MGTNAVIVIAAIVAAVVVLGVAVLTWTRRSTHRTTTEPVPASRPAAPPATPMTDLESALAKVTDREGRPIKDRIDAESVHVDPLRDPDDTGPLLRRALDSVVHHDDHHHHQHDHRAEHPHEHPADGSAPGAESDPRQTGA